MSWDARSWGNEVRGKRVKSNGYGSRDSGIGRATKKIFLRDKTLRDILCHGIRDYTTGLPETKDYIQVKKLKRTSID